MISEIKSGLEIHQQLDTNKLFCNCLSILRNDEPDYKINRKLHAVAGEEGRIDKAVKYESEIDKEFEYQGYDTTCLVELDEEPPHIINPEALEIGLHIALLLNCEILPITQIMRKTVIDGSNTSGFQRTVLIARNGFIQTKYGRVGIENVSLEEDSARKIEENENKKVYRLDRLGIPLIEIGTYPDIKSAEQVKETALFIGDVLRSCKVKRGIGTIRQDINISIKGHPRVEIKGFQDVKMFMPTIEKEIVRQEANIKDNILRGEVRNALEDGSSVFLRPISGASRMYPETDLPLLKISKNIINKAKESLPKLRSEVKEELSKKGLRQDEINILLKENYLEEFVEFLKIINNPRLIFKALIEIPKEIGRHQRRNLTEINKILSTDIIESLINDVKNNKISKDDLKHVMEDMVKGKSYNEAVKLEKVDSGDVESEIIKIIKEKPGLSIKGYMGLIMNKYKGRISGKEASEILSKLVK